MRIEDGLIVLLALATSGVLLAGLAQALDGGRGARRSRRSPPEPDRSEDRRDPGPVAVAPEPAAPPAPATRPDVTAAARPLSLVAAHEPASVVPPAPAAEAASVTTPAPPEAPAGIAACLRAYEAGDYAAAESGAAALARKRAEGKRGGRGRGGSAPLEQVAVWSALGLSRRSLGDEEGAAAAFASGARWAGAVSTRPLPPAALEGLAPRLGRHLLTIGEALREGAPSRGHVLRLAATWLGASAVGAPADGDLAALAARAAEGYAAAVQGEVAERIGRRDFAAAHGAIDDALGGIAIPEARRGELRDLLWTSLTGEVGRLVGHALHGAGGAAAPDGMAALAAAAEVVAGVPPGSISPERHQDLGRRLWWAHMQLGGQRRERGELDAALAPLLHALELAAGDPPREGEAREAVARVIEALAERIGGDIRDRLRVGDLDSAMAASRRLGEVVDDALSRGLAPGDLAGALARRQEVMLELAEGRPA